MVLPNESFINVTVSLEAAPLWQKTFIFWVNHPHFLVLMSITLRLQDCYSTSRNKKGREQNNGWEAFVFYFKTLSWRFQLTISTWISLSKSKLPLAMKNAGKLCFS